MEACGAGACCANGCDDFNGCDEVALREQDPSMLDELDDGEARVEECKEALGACRNATAAAHDETRRSEESAEELRGKLGDAESAHEKHKKAIRDLKASCQSDLRASQQTVQDKTSELESCRAKLESDSRQKDTKITKAMGVKDEQLEAYHQTIVGQKKEIEEKTRAVVRLSDDLHTARK
eukprot:CAMPEP_0171998998 /NCGR_PEP_ID=MMETSP1041-20130122/1537_1 /TAXON_ID=464988 /ORGANISM="Hemiselmis andersenii, Strain CCMP439" /LENGTH=179 /DNA_ID=CAMNT_0012652413 /DNA_START=1 /DNA_END=538 /DNA_ORIENTATION=-